MEKQSSPFGILDSFKRLKECGARGGGVKRVVTKDHFQTSGVDINQHLFEHQDPVFPYSPSSLGRSLVFPLAVAHSETCQAEFVAVFWQRSKYMEYL